MTERDDVLALAPSLQFGQWLGLLLVVIIGYLLYRSAVKRD